MCVCVCSMRAHGFNSFSAHVQYAKVRSQNGGHGVPSFDAFIAVACLFCCAFVAISTFSPWPFGLLREHDHCDGIERCVCPRATICARNLRSMLFLGVSR